MAMHQSIRLEHTDITYGDSFNVFGVSFSQWIMCLPGDSGPPIASAAIYNKGRTIAYLAYTGNEDGSAVNTLVR